MMLVWLVSLGLRLGYHAISSIDATLILGGSIRREIYGAEHHLAQSDQPLLISGGSQLPCLYLLFKQYQAPLDQVWVEPCAQSTFDNFFYAAPILQRWQVRKVALISSGSHYSRAVQLGRIILGAQGIWVVGQKIEEWGIPGNQESRWKTVVDWLRGGAWAIGSQFYRPHCAQLTSLESVDGSQWLDQAFHCEHQAGIGQQDQP